MVPGFFYIVGCQVFERQHSLNIQISCSGDQVLLICILRRQLVSDQMAAVIHIFSIHEVILLIVPARRLDLPDRAAFFRRHRIRTYRSVCHAASSQRIEVTVALKGDIREIALRKIRNISIDRNIR